MTYLLSHGIKGMLALMKHLTIAKAVDNATKHGLRHSCFTDRIYWIYTAILLSMYVNEVPFPLYEVQAPNCVLFMQAWEKDCTTVATNGSLARQSVIFETSFTCECQSVRR